MLIIKHIFIIYIYKYCKIRLSLKTKQKINNHLKPKMIKKNRVYCHLAYNQHKVNFFLNCFLFRRPRLATDLSITLDFGTNKIFYICNESVLPKRA